MAYATIDDVVGRYRPLETRIGSGEFESSSAEVNSIFIFGAESIVDGFIGKKYVTPISLTPVPQLVTHLTADLAVFNMVVELNINVPDNIQGRYDRAISMLEMLRDGDMVLGNSVDVLTTGDEEVFSNTEDYHAIFSPVLDETQQRVDKDRVESDLNDRVDDDDNVCPL